MRHGRTRTRRGHGACGLRAGQFSVGQSLDIQRDKLFEEKKSGALDKRPRLQACLEYVREGDSLVVTRPNRLARSMLHLCRIAE